MKNNKQAVIYTILAIASWSTVASAFKIGLRYYTYFELILVASIVAMFAFAVVMTLQQKWKLIRKIELKGWVSYMYIGLLNPALYYLILFRSYDLLPAQIAQPINYFWPTLLTLLLAIFFRQNIPAFKFIGMLISFAGVILISVGTERVADIELSKTGILLAFASAFLWALFWILNRNNQKTDMVVGLFLSFLFGTLYLSVAAMFIPVNLISTAGLLAAAYVGLFEMAIPFIFFGLALQKSTNLSFTNQLIYLSPFISLFIIHLVLDETIYFTTYVGLFLIVSGILLNEYLSRSRKRIKVK